MIVTLDARMNKELSYRNNKVGLHLFSVKVPFNFIYQGKLIANSY